ncbi:hypothetical protein [Chitinilyticum piscinae]|uniref:Uncharacterized protein n=1 Tax=Chitinilyticum piscinae TaxID=2866724 RepID=A0A8J7G1X8_9NEIS|nr:hypothetical protein [Chitinilyticum piscinae]MBE9609878.1 hypothetical protein [Chitinilyticum piscinae]
MKSVLLMIALVLTIPAHAEPVRACVPAYGEARYQDADGNGDLFAGQRFVVRQSKTGKVLYRGRIDASGVARWTAGCKGEKLTIQLVQD